MLPRRAYSITSRRRWPAACSPTPSRGHAIAVFESTARTTLCLILMLLVPHVVWLVTPFIRPFRWSRLLLTYLFPVIPTVAFIDGVVSCLRTYTPDELRELAKSVDGATGYDWTAGHAGGGPIPMTYLVGTPVRQHGAAPEEAGDSCPATRRRAT